MKPIKDGKLVGKITESTAQWKPSVASNRGKFPVLPKNTPNPPIGMPKVNPLQAPKGELGGARQVPNPKQ